MKSSDFYFNLPEELIAQYPAKERGKSRLLLMNRKTQSLEHRMIHDLPNILEKGTLMVFNNSRVRRARLFAKSTEANANFEFLLLDKIDSTGTTWQVMLKKAHRHKPESRFLFPQKNEANAFLEAQLIVRKNAPCLLKFEKPIDDSWLDINGHMPLPPYIKRKTEKDDAERYQTVYARQHGSLAAPTAGLHFT